MKRCTICSKLTIKTPELQQSPPDVFVVNFEHISQIFVGFFIVDFEQVHFSWNVMRKLKCVLVYKETAFPRKYLSVQSQE